MIFSFITKSNWAKYLDRIIDHSHHLDISVIVHDQGIVASKLQQVLAPSVDRKII